MTSSRVSSIWKAACLTAIAAWAVGLASVPAAARSAHGTNDVKVSVSFNMQVPLADTSEASITEAQKDRRKLIYQVLSRECSVLKELIADTCRLTNVNVSTQIRSHRHNQPLFLHLNGSAQFSITQKKGAPSGG
ncbi:MAG: hypothetical protein MI824_26010 [Hyphomicrobiales bacterium]|nr:hypothetical protein [Hyphomicrobiales bacterium]